jgi:hypothetical protein
MGNISTTALLTALLAAGFLIAPAHAGDSQWTSWQGTWHLNKAETHYPPGVHVTSNDLVVGKDDGKTLEYVETVVNDGQTQVQPYKGAYDGKFYDVGNDEVMSFKHLSKNSYLAIRHDKNGFLLERSTFVLSNGGKKLTCHAWAQRPGGKPVKFDEIFDKAE